MAIHQNRGTLALRIGALAAVAALFTLLPSPARAYLYRNAGANLVRWNATSSGSIWNDTTKTLSWSFTSISFPQVNWPSVAQAGAAFQNGYQTFQDTTGANIRFNRLPNTTTPPSSNDSLLQMSLTPTETQDYYSNNITGIYGVTYVLSDTVSGALLDADIILNGDANTWNWAASGPPAPAGTIDIEVTAIHEQLHSIGGGHTVYFYSVLWPTGRLPETLMFDRCLGPDDRMLLRTLYPQGTPFSTVSGVVTNAIGGAVVNKAVVVATDANGIPQATTTTDTSGAYSINVPSGAGYSLAAHNHFNSTYEPSTINFATATDFISCTPRAVNASASIGGQDFTVDGGTPTLKLLRLALGTNKNLLNDATATQTLFLGKGQGGQLMLEFPGLLTAGNFTAVSLGAGITVSGVTTTASTNPNNVVATMTYNVGAVIPAGVRNISVTRGTETCFMPGYIEVTDIGGLTVSAGVQNPGVGSAPFNTQDHPLLQVNLTASPVEDIRIRSLRFDLAGTGSTLPSVRLWVDGGATPGIVDGTDTRVFSGAAYSIAGLNEAIAAAPPTTVSFDNLALTIPAGTTRTLLLTANMPASGTGSYTASFNPAVTANITAHGMWWGDVCVPTGTTITGGNQSLGLLAIGSLNQLHTSAPVVAIPVGGSTDEAQITLRGIVTSSTGTLGMEVEVKPTSTAFTGTGTVTLPTVSASGSTLSINVTGLTSGVAYHWQARALSSSSPPSGWVSFGGNAETATDFTCDTSVTGAPAVGGMQQFLFDGVTVIPLGGSTPGYAVLQATTGTNSQGLSMRIEVEVQPTGTAFTGNPQYSSGFAPTGTPLTVLFTSNVTNDFHWQARCVSQFGSRSGFTNFNAAAIHFHLNAIQTISADAGCMGKASESHDGGWLLWTAAGATLLLLTFLKGGARKAAASLVLVLCIGAAAQAEEEGTLPRSLAESFESPRISAWPEAPPLDPLLEPEPLFAPVRSFMTLDAYLGFMLMDMDFDALGTDLVRREVSGMGTGVLGIEGLFDILPDWRLGLAAEVATWGDIRIIAVGPVGTWCFSGSHRNATTGLSDTQHFVKLGLFYEKLTVNKSNFGSFDASFGARLGYELRISLGDRWAVTVGAALQYSQWDYSESIIRGDDKIGGFGGLITVGAAWLP